MEAKVSDFGLSKFALQAAGVSHISTVVKQTAGYLDSEQIPHPLPMSIELFYVSTLNTKG
jgi:hypothetical protein